MRWSEISESKLDIVGLINSCQSHFGSGNLFSGNCGTFALALATILEEQGEVPRIVVICEDVYGDGDEAEPEDILTSDARVYHVAVYVRGSLFDGDGKVTNDSIADWIEREYNDFESAVFNFDLYAPNLVRMVENSTDWNISTSTFLKFMKSITPGQLEESLNTRLYYHSSVNELDVGTILTGRGSDYDRDWGYVPFFEVLERYRPADKLSHRDAVFMVSNEDDLDSAGGSTEYVFTLQPLGPVYKHDMNWSSLISSLVDDGHDYDSQELKTAAENYWAGKPTDDPLWEYLTTKAKIVAVQEY
jgi:hypothetical protein